MDTKSLIKEAGGPTAVAAIFGIHSQAVSQWKRIPVNRCAAIEQATGIPRSRLRPDVWDAPAEAVKAARAKKAA